MQSGYTLEHTISTTPTALTQSSEGRVSGEVGAGMNPSVLGGVVASKLITVDFPRCLLVSYAENRDQYQHC